EREEITSSEIKFKPRLGQSQLELLKRYTPGDTEDLRKRHDVAAFIECDMIEEYARNVGILQGANKIPVIRMDLPKGYVYRVRRENGYEGAGHLNKIPNTRLCSEGDIMCKICHHKDVEHDRQEGSCSRKIV
ncbi:6797_t:CDS:2, partial [Ambispora leptoticha]